MLESNTDLTYKTSKYLIEAANIATKSELNYRHGAILVNSSRILSTGFNQSRSKFGSITTSCMHAEVACLHNFVTNYCHDSFNGKIKNKKYKRLLNRSTLYVVRIPKTDNSLNYLNFSQPCKDCERIIKCYGVKNIVYSDINCTVTKKKSKDLNSNYVTKGNLRIPID